MEPKYLLSKCDIGLIDKRRVKILSKTNLKFKNSLVLVRLLYYNLLSLRFFLPTRVQCDDANEYEVNIHYPVFIPSVFNNLYVNVVTFIVNRKIPLPAANGLSCLHLEIK